MLGAMIVFAVVAAVIGMAQSLGPGRPTAGTARRAADALVGAAARNQATLSMSGTQAVLERDGLRIEITLDVGEEHTHITWRITVPPPGTIRFRIYGQRLGTFTNHMFGSFEFPSSALPGLHEQFQIVADDEAQLRALWTDEHCTLFLEQFRDTEIASDGNQIDISMPTILDISRLDAGIRLLFGLASVDLWGFADLQRALPDGRFERAGGHVELPGPGRVRVGLMRGEVGVITYARGEAGDVTVIPPSVREHATELGVDSIDVRDGEVIVTWPSIERDPQRLAGCVELLRGFVTAPSDGVFR